MPTVKEALDNLYTRAGDVQRSVTMREFLSGHKSNASAAAALSGTDNRKSKEYKTAIRNVQRYQNFITGKEGKESRNPDNVRVQTLTRATQAQGRARAKRDGIVVKKFKGKIKTSPKKKRGNRAGTFDASDENRTRGIQNIEIPGAALDKDVLDGDTRGFSDVFLDAYGAGAIGELYDIDELELGYGDGQGEGENDDE